MKKFVTGFVTCIILMSTLFISGLAEDALTVLLNKFPIFVNGQQAEIEAYNINGRLYLSVGDVAKYLNTTVTFNEVTKRYDIKGPKAAAQSSQAAKSEKATVPNLMVDKDSGKIIDVATKEVTSAEFVYLDRNFKEIPPDKYVDYLDLKVVKYNGFTYVFINEILLNLKLGYKSLDYLEQGKCEFYKGDKEVTYFFNDPNVYIRVDGKYYYNADIFKSLIGE